MGLEYLNSILTKSHKIALMVFVFMGVLHNFIANDKYLIAKTDKGIEFMILGNDIDWGIRAMIPYSSKSIDKDNRGVSPFGVQKVSCLYHRHWLGTDALGRDVLAGILNGSFIALVVGVFTLIISLFIGVCLAFISAYYGDGSFRIEKRYVYALIPISIIVLFYAYYLHWSWSFILLTFLMYLWIKARNISRIGRHYTYAMPLDMIVFRILDIFNSIPGMFFILVLLALFEKASVTNVVLVIAFLKWPIITRHLRAEILKLKEEDYIASAKSMGLSDLKIFVNHILPMAISPVIIVLAFGFSSAVLMESTLSFLGLGVPLDEVTWGSIIRQARQNFSHWWLALFPGLAIYAIVVLFNSIGNAMNKNLRME